MSLKLKKRIKEKESQHLDHSKKILHEAGWKDRYYGDKYKKVLKQVEGWKTCAGNMLKVYAGS